MTSRLRLMIFGPQGVGKGTQAERLAPALGIEHLSTGALLRQSVGDGSPLGQSVRSHLDQGDLVPDDLILDLVLPEIERLDRSGVGYVLDGFPRTIDQAVALAAVADAPLIAAIELSADLDVLIDRLLRRLVCVACRATCTAPAGYVDTVRCECGDGVAVRRADDTPAAIGNRLALFDRHADPLRAWFHGASQVLTVNGDDLPERVHADILDALDTVLGVGALGGSAEPACALAGRRLVVEAGGRR